MIYIKTDSEIAIMKKAGEIVAKAHEKIGQAIRPGVTTFELDKIAEDVIRSNNAIPSFLGYKAHTPGAIDYPASICASVNEEVVHGIPDKRMLKEGDIIGIDIGACYNGFHGDAARTHMVGKVSQKAEELVKVTMESFFEGIRFARSGNHLSEISGAVQDYVERYGFSVVRDFVGHGVGHELQERPEVPNYRTSSRGPRLEKGLTLAIEPMVNIGQFKVKMLANKWTVVTADGSLSAHYENTIAITDGEPMILTAL